MSFFAVLPKHDDAIIYVIFIVKKKRITRSDATCLIRGLERNVLFPKTSMDLHPFPKTIFTQQIMYIMYYTFLARCLPITSLPSDIEWDILVLNHVLDLATHRHEK